MKTMLIVMHVVYFTDDFLGRLNKKFYKTSNIFIPIADQFSDLNHY